ncbi:AMP-dependent synthetase/ligase [Pseudonocardia broussonetiae]|uniref:Long-chain fatty acid--CoA ligase n=1 Tax=Pseudonocardia broussonetiae TaxID=2736640 RepID=A0A6M6JMV4_9PSEU|nr:AMP-dependent synthetase/ligase [Pseudonocardia broussonetiae]QJY48676.1 long-chain fatty acid--CoA ligase [Pseudonocardia broussonetiae]
MTAIPTLARLEQSTSLCEVLLATASSRLDQPALRSHGSKDVWTYRQVLARIGEVASRLRQCGVGRGDVVALLLRNRPEFHVVDAAVLFLGAVPFSLYSTAPPEQLRHVLVDSGARLLVTERAFAGVVEATRRLDTPLERVLVIDQPAAADDGLASELAADTTGVDLSSAGVGPDDLLTLIYTSGTTGPPKGVELTHRNMLEQLRGVHASLPLGGGGRQVSFLPAAHVADRWASHYSAFMTYGNTVTSVADASQLFDAITETRPTVFGAVPRIWEKLKARAEADHDGDLVSDAPGNPALAARVRERLGLDAATWVNTGAAPTPPSVVEFFDAVGLPLCEVLGMSEVSCLVTISTPTSRRPGSVGTPLSGVELALADDGELLVRSAQVMRRYRGLPEKTAEAIDANGWFHTGDVARIDGDGFVWIVDRKKELIINAAGKNMSPANIEMALLTAGRAISQVCVIGDRRAYNVCLVVPNRAAFGSDEAAVSAAVQAQVDAANAGLARVEQIKKFAVLDAEWLPGHELTPTMKLRRRVIDATYSGVIESLYRHGDGGGGA